jgi:serine/threonine-protein phosphatase 2A regulatory subunit A
MDSSPFELFKEELDNEDIQIKVNTVHRLSIVLALLTPDRITGEVIPYLLSKIVLIFRNVTNRGR